MYQISDGDNTYLVSDDLRMVFDIAMRNSFDHTLFVVNTLTNVELTIHNGRIVGDNKPTHHHGNGIGPTCTILNCGE